ncbi:MAG: hypothetical protein MI794_18300 [Pseudomonadales bacterium]|nr:hypothetical protein [Pseudomonadales bacterium]
MSYQIYSSNYFAGHGYPILVVTDPALSGNRSEFVSECHAFFSGVQGSYALFTVKFKEEDKSHIDREEVAAAARQSGEFHLNEYLAEKSQVQYQAILAGFGGKFALAENKLLLQLHLRNFLSSEIESKIQSNTNDADLKSYVKMVSGLSRVTTEKKI